MDVRALQNNDRGWLRCLVEREWGLPVVSISGAYDAADLPGYVAWDGSERIGAVTVRFDDDSCEIVTMNALRPGCGVGQALLAAVKQVADAGGSRLWLITTDDNLRAMAFYQRQGMHMTTVHLNFVETVRRYKPQLETANHRVTFRHAIEFSY